MRKVVEKEIVKDSSPGYPYASLGTTNGKVLEKHGDFIWKCVEKRLNKWMATSLKTIEGMTSEELVKFGLVDPVKVFVKDEPHKLSKIQEGRLRIISSVSLVDQIIERLLHRIQNKVEIERWNSCPSKPGLGLHDDGLLDLTANMEALLEVNGAIDCSDVSAWDWTVQGWELELDMEIRIRLARAEPGSAYQKLCRVNGLCVSKTVFVDPEGDMWGQVDSGIQLSGRYCTSSSNSRMRVMATLLSRLRLTGKCTVTKGEKEILGIMSMGDDSVEVTVPGLKEEINEIGHICKQSTTFTQVRGVDFCSHVFDGAGNAYPSAPSKTVYRFLSHKASTATYDELWVQLAWFLRHLGGAEKELIVMLGNARVERAKENGEIGSNEKACKTATSGPGAAVDHFSQSNTRPCAS